MFNCGGDEIRHLVKDDSKPLTPEQQQKEDERFNKEFSEIQKKQAELANDPKKQEKEDERQQAQISDFLRAESFTNPRRERFRGQDVIVFDFGANPITSRASWSSPSSKNSLAWCGLTNRLATWPAWKPASATR